MRAPGQTGGVRIENAERCVLAEVTQAAPGQGLACHPVAHLVALDLRPYLHHIAHELVTQVDASDSR